MRRRTFCASGLTALVSASLPYSRVFAAAGDDVAVMGLGGEQRVLKPTDIDDFRSSLRGQLLMPGANATRAPARCGTEPSIASPR